MAATPNLITTHRTPPAFTVRRSEPNLIPPSKPTPRETKPLSDIDDQESLRFQVPAIQFYRRSNHRRRDDPAKVIRAAVAEALVYYYSLAGRLREVQVGPTTRDRKLVVECTGEGVAFVEGEADVSLDELEEFLQPPFPCLEELLFDVVHGPFDVLDCPIILIQVTRLKCGGFVLALRFIHAMLDASGLIQFLNAVAEFARGTITTKPSIAPVWERHLLNARVPPRVTCVHREYDEVKGTMVPFNEMVHRSFTFGPHEISGLKRTFLPIHVKATNFEVLAATIWRCRAIAHHASDPQQEVRLLIPVNMRSKFDQPLNTGYYGNAFVFCTAISTVEKLTSSPLLYALDTVKKAKADASDDYMNSVADLMALRGRPHVAVIGTLVLSDWSRLGLDEVDYGWGKPVYGGPAKAGVGAVPGILGFFSSCKAGEGEKGIRVSICFPGPVMGRFADEVDKMLHCSSVGSQISIY